MSERASDRSICETNEFLSDHSFTGEAPSLQWSECPTVPKSLASADISLAGSNDNISGLP